MNASAPVEWPRRLLILGCGNMGGAMLAGWLRAGFEPERFTVVDPMMAQGPDGVVVLRELPAPNARLDKYDAVLLGVKPQLLDAVAPGLNAWLKALSDRPKVVLSLLAGVELASLENRLPAATSWVRIMPNLAAAIGKSPMGVVGAGYHAEHPKFITDLLAPLGTPEWFQHEGAMDAVTALAGSGPAFVYRFIDALAQGGAEIGLPADQALRLALATVEGAAALAAEAGVPPAELARRVASPGGTTEAGLKVLDAATDGIGAMARLVAATLTAARDRSVAMAEAARAAS